MKALLKSAGLTQTQLADRVGLTRSQISDYANNRYVMRIPHARNIAAALNCRIEDLYEWRKVS